MQPVVMAPENLSTPKTAPRENQTKDPKKTNWKVQRGAMTNGAEPGRTRYGDKLTGG